MSRRTNAFEIFALRLSNEPMEPTQNKYSNDFICFTVGTVSSSRPSTHFTRSLRLMPHGLLCRSMFWKVREYFRLGIFPSVRTR